jgi:hypothetical protein
MKEQEDALPDEDSFASAIQHHLELKRRNASLEYEMPLARYLPDSGSTVGDRLDEDAGFEEADTLTSVVPVDSLWPLG